MIRDRKILFDHVHFALYIFRYNRVMLVHVKFNVSKKNIKNVLRRIIKAKRKKENNKIVEKEKLCISKGI